MLSHAVIHSSFTYVSYDGFSPYMSSFSRHHGDRQRARRPNISTYTACKIPEISKARRPRIENVAEVQLALGKTRDDSVGFA